MAEDLSKKLYVENFDSWKKTILRKRFVDDELEVKVIEHGIVLPTRKINTSNAGGVCDNNFNFVAGFSRSYGGIYVDPWASVESAYTVDKKDIVQLDEDVIFGGALIGHFGHFIMECWNRLWYVIQNPQLKSKILFILILGYKPYFDEFFRLMGINKERIVYVDKPMQCRSVTVPDQSQYSFINFTKEYLLPYLAIKSRVIPSNVKKLYLTRRIFDESYLKKIVSGEENLPRQAICFNEKYFEDFFAARGFKVIAPENLSVAEQLSLISGADEIATTLGTLSNWAIFCKPETKFIMLSRTSSMSVPFQCLVNEAVHLNNAYFVDASKNFMYATHVLSVCMLGANKYWKAFVENYFGEQIKEDDDRPYFENALDMYIYFWYKKYATEPKIMLYTLKNMCNRIIALEKELER